ncbi:MAG: hypothetical protein AAF501_15120 [Pseudomonadota bacterium]
MVVAGDQKGRDPAPDVRVMDEAIKGLEHRGRMRALDGEPEFPGDGFRVDSCDLDRGAELCAGFFAKALGRDGDKIHAAHTVGVRILDGIFAEPGRVDADAGDRTRVGCGTVPRLLRRPGPRRVHRGSL